MRFSDQSVGVKITAVVLLGLCTTAVVGVTGHGELARTDDQVLALVTDQAKPAIALGSTRESFARVRSRLAQAAAFDTQKDIDSALSKLSGYEKAVRDGLAQLPSRQRDLLLLTFAEPNVPYRQISRRLGIPAGSIGPTRARTLHKLGDTDAVRALAS